jgi:hypothetical protein
MIQVTFYDSYPEGREIIRSNDQPFYTSVL